MRPSRRQMLPFTRRWTEGRLSVTAVLVGAHAAAYAAQFVVEMLGPYHGVDPNWLWSWFALTGPRVADGNFWQFVSYALLHAGPRGGCLQNETAMWLCYPADFQIFRKGPSAP